jgi:hypothetical protein
MADRQCSGITKAGERCTANPIRGGEWCIFHSPDHAEKRVDVRHRAGLGRRNTERALKRLPKSLQDTLDVLYRTLSALESGDLEPSRATAVATVSRAIVAVSELGQFEMRLQEIEKQLAGQSDAQRRVS